MSGAQHDQVADWDGAYVLGALSPADRRLYEVHLEDCARCREAVAELAPLPGMLARFTPEQPAPSGGESTPPTDRLSEAEPAPPPPSDPAPVPLDARRRLRRRLLASLTAAAALALVLTLPQTLGEQEDEPALTVSARAPGGTTAPMQVDVALSPVPWGTALTITCEYPDATGSTSRHYSAPTTYALVLTAEDGTRSEVSSWQGLPGEVATIDAGTAHDLAEIESLEVVDGSGTTVLSAEVEDSSTGE